MTNEQKAYLAVAIAAQFGGVLAISHGFYASAFAALTVFIACMFGIGVTEILNRIDNHKEVE